MRKTLEESHGAGYLFLIGFLFVVACLLQGCASTDPLTLQNMERFKTVWEEDRRPDLDEAKVKAREFEFDQAIEYEKSKGGK